MAKVLVIDDEPDVLMLCRVNLEHAGHDVLVAESGEAGLELARNERPDLIVLDLMMPKMDGWEFRQRQLSDPEFAGIPVLIMSGYPNADKAAGTLGVRTVLKKPLSVPRLLSLVNRHCTRDARRASTA